METRVVMHDVTLNAAPEEVFEVLMDSARHSQFTGAPAQIDRKTGGEFSLYGGQLTGNTLELKPHERIVQQWRAADWPDGHYSSVRFDLTPIDGGRQTQLSLTHRDVPAAHFEEINQGWRKYYWTKMAPYFREQKVAVVRHFMEEFKNRANLDIVDELFTPDFVLHLPGVQLPRGPQGQKAVGQSIFAAFSGVQVTVNDTIVEGDRVVERHTARAVHTGEFNGVPATGKNVSWTENHIYRLRDGRIAETWSEVSFHDLMAQISQDSSAAARAR
ncbi:MAG: Activator of 90 kDa heat shock protein ATPase [Bryobacterales bacterium]|nr:Activator of 90 kDa heat shock protein ATPase [Bryobacterales bacterium]